jgi:hypothetical protein
MAPKVNPPQDPEQTSNPPGQSQQGVKRQAVSKVDQTQPYAEGENLLLPGDTPLKLKSTHRNENVSGFL